MPETFSRSSLIHIATELADRLADRVAAFNPSSSVSEAGRGLAEDSGIAIFFAAMLQTREKPSYRSALHAYLKAATELREPMRGGLFTGIHGLLAACNYAMLVEPRYSALLEKCASAAERFEPTDNAWQKAHWFGDFDIIAGMAGRAIALAFAVPRMRARVSCDYLAWLIENSERWRCPHPSVPERGAMKDIGMAHGLAGMVAALAIAAPDEERYERAVRLAAEELCTLRLDPQAKGWPTMIETRGPLYSTTAWCYGTPGCASALLLASQRCGDSKQAQVARESLLVLAKQSHDNWSVPDHGLCHGSAGNALIYATAARFFEDEELARARDRIIASLIAGFEVESKYGYRAKEPDGLVDRASLLTGTAGIGLALLTLSEGCDPSWMTLFGMPSLTATVND